MAWQTKNALTADGVAGPDTFMAMGLYELVLLKQGARGDAVKKLQEKFGVGADGQFGPGTEKAVRDYQQKNGLVTPFGTPASSSISAKTRAEDGVYSDGFSIMVQPAASAGATR